MKTTVESTVSINSNPTSVFEYLCDLSLHPLWNPQIESISSTKTLELGDTYTTVSRMLGIQLNSTNQVTKLVEHKVLELKNDTGAVRYKIYFKLKNVKGTTVVASKTSIATESKYFSFARPVLGIVAKRELHAKLELLKVTVENNLKPEPAKITDTKKPDA